MIRYFLLISVVCCSLSVCAAQEIGKLLPWLQLSDHIKMGMSAESLHEIYPFLQDSVGGQDIVEGDLFFDQDRKIHQSEDVAFGIRGDLLTKFYWSSKERISPEAVNEIRVILQKNFGTPKVGYKARLTRNGIAKITTEVYEGGSGGDIVVSLSSALQATELAVIDLDAEGVSEKELYFSYEDQKKELQSELARLTGKAPEEEEPSECADVLASLISESSDDQNTRPRRHNNDLRENNPDDLRKQQTIHRPDQKGYSQENAGKKKSNLPWVIAGVLLVGILALLFKTFKGKSML